MGLFSRDKPKIKVESEKADGFSGWLKCTSCHEMIHKNELAENLNCCPKCDSHYRISARERIELLADKDSFVELFVELMSIDSLQFEDSKKYPKRLEEARSKSGENDAVITGICTVNGLKSCLAVMNFGFMAGSMGSVVGEKLARLMEHSLKKKLPLVVVTTSGGARMQESTLSLMQMAKTSAVLAKLHEGGVPYVSILTNPTTGGVTASFASLGDVIIAEPDALVCFAGPRVVEQVIREKLPPGAQKSEFVLEHGMIDLIARRHDLKQKLHQVLDFLSNNQRKYNSKQQLTTDEITEKLQDLFNHAKTPCKN